MRERETDVGPKASTTTEARPFIFHARIVLLLLTCAYILTSPIIWSRTIGSNPVISSSSLRRKSARSGTSYHKLKSYPAVPGSWMHSVGKSKAIHVALIFDEGRFNFTVAVMRSIVYHHTVAPHSTNTPIVFHAILSHSIVRNVTAVVSSEFIRHYGKWHVALETYDIRQCNFHTSSTAFMAPHIHLSAMCKIFLADILPMAVTRVLYIDSDVVVTAPLDSCTPDFSNSSAMIGMAVDMGEVCQHYPSKCLPIGFEWKVPDGLVCGRVPWRADFIQENKLPCPDPGDTETYQFNGGVMWMDLAKMRQQSFTTHYVATAVYTYFHLLDYKHARVEWGEQDLVNNLFRFHPEYLHELSCGCNYQFSGVRRESKCVSERVVIAHGWGRPMSDPNSKAPYKLYFDFFRVGAYPDFLKVPPPSIPSLAAPSADWEDGVIGKPVHSPFCRLQSIYNCSREDFSLVDGVLQTIARPYVPAAQAWPQPVLYLLTRTSKQPRLFEELEQSIAEQSYGQIRLVVETDDRNSLDDVQGLYKVVEVPSQATLLDFREVCKKCPSLVAHTHTDCASAPFKCHCVPNYPLNGYANFLVHEVSASTLRDGWVMVLHDNFIMSSKHSAAELMNRVALKGLMFTSPEKRNDVVYAFRASLGERTTSNDVQFYDRWEAMGNFAGSNFIYHSSRAIRWPRTGCEDVQTAMSFQREIDETIWIDKSLVKENRKGYKSQGNGLDSLSPSSVTVIITSYQTKGWRPVWVERIIEYYLTEKMSTVVEKVILVWNNKDSSVPSNIPHPSQYPGRFVVVANGINSLNNRWVNTLPHINGASNSLVLNLDDDIYVTREGLFCMLNWYKSSPRRIIAPFVRRVTESGQYVLDELLDGSMYSIALPRIMLLSVEYMKIYASREYEKIRDYVDSQEAHCDDILLNVVAFKSSGEPPLRILLPDESIVDFYSKCWEESREMTGGLALQVDRAQKRSECTKEILRLSNLQFIGNSTDIATCLANGGRESLQERRYPVRRFDKMAATDISCSGAQ